MFIFIEYARLQIAPKIINTTLTSIALSFHKGDIRGQNEASVFEVQYKKVIKNTYFTELNFFVGVFNMNNLLRKMKAFGLCNQAEHPYLMVKTLQKYQIVQWKQNILFE